ncbi:GDSL/SGNH-like acyl-esterase family found in Pmr5 and Cas1p-domain-containing protein [Phycomyces blakesleeanus]|uniref:GDSL/SGNH-like acyl-esterase family found in Pmr5 and Cas1p-domain-containing protein n=1 Tax=Phycomyces blakesleeanus TaxID=4837 RepID=A0ABR3AV48_PHYBL
MSGPVTLQFHSKLVYLLAGTLCFLFWLFIWSWQENLRMLLPTSNDTSEPTTTTNNKSPQQFTQPMVADLSQINSSLCTIETYNQGQWKYRPLNLKPVNRATIDKAVGYHCKKQFTHMCYRRDDPKELQRSKRMLDYSWEPESCSVLPLDPEAFAKHLSKKSLLMIGDSITQLHYESLSCLLGEYIQVPKTETRVNGGDSYIKPTQHVYKQAQDGDKEVSMAYVRADYLLRLDDFKLIAPFEDEGDQMGRGHNYPWVHAIPYFDYVIINTGPHWHPNFKWGPNRSQDEMLAAFKEAMGIVFDHLKANVKPHQTIWIRSTPYGHANCSQYTVPQNIPFQPTGQPKEYEWHMFEAFDNVWKEWIKEENDSRFQFLDVSLTNRRGDAHSRPDKDCLHTCIPGPVDDWNRLLFHEMAKKSV